MQRRHSISGSAASATEPAAAEPAAADQSTVEPLTAEAAAAGLTFEPSTGTWQHIQPVCKCSEFGIVCTASRTVGSQHVTKVLPGTRVVTAAHSCIVRVSKQNGSAPHPNSCQAPASAGRVPLPATTRLSSLKAQPASPSLTTLTVVGRSRGVLETGLGCISLLAFSCLTLTQLILNVHIANAASTASGCTMLMIVACLEHQPTPPLTCLCNASKLWPQFA